MNNFLKSVIVVAAGAALVWGGLWYNKRAEERAAEEAKNVEAQVAEQERKIMEQLKIEDVRVGTGAEAKTGDVVKVNYLGTFTDGKKFDSSYDRGDPFEFTLGKGEVIPGWDRGVLGMKVGGKRRLTVPPELAYGPQGYGPIPANSTLMFEIELLDVRSTP